MIPELSIARISFDGSDFEIMPKNAALAPKDDQLQSLREAEQNQYSSFFIIERSTRSEFSEDGRDDLWALRNYAQGVYILIKTEPTPTNRRSVFVGMAGLNEEMIDIYRREPGKISEMEDINSIPTLAQCLEEQNENPPVSMKNWDFAIVIPVQEQVSTLFAALYSIFDRAEGFMLRKKVNKNASSELAKMSDAQHKCVNVHVHMHININLVLLSLAITISLGEVIVVIVAAIYATILLKKITKKLLGEIKEGVIKFWNSIKRKFKKQDSSPDKNRDFKNSEGDKLENLVYNIVQYSDENFPRKANLFPRIYRDPYDNFGE